VYIDKIEIKNILSILSYIDKIEIKNILSILSFYMLNVQIFKLGEGGQVNEVLTLQYRKQHTSKKCIGQYI